MALQSLTCILGYVRKKYLKGTIKTKETKCFKNYKKDSNRTEPNHRSNHLNARWNDKFIFGVMVKNLVQKLVA